MLISNNYSNMYFTANPKQFHRSAKKLVGLVKSVPQPVIDSLGYTDDRMTGLLFVNPHNGKRKVAMGLAEIYTCATGVPVQGYKK